MNIACFRYYRPEIDEEKLDVLNRELLMRIHESGVAVPSNAVVNGRYGICVAITNHRSQWCDFDLLISTVLLPLPKR